MGGPPGYLAGADRCRTPFDGMDRAVRIKVLTNAGRGLKIFLIEQQSDVGFFFQPDAVLPGDAPAELYAGAQDGGAGFDDTVQLARRAHVKEDIRMEIAVSGVEDIGDLQIELLADLRHALHHLRQAAAGPETI